MATQICNYTKMMLIFLTIINVFLIKTVLCNMHSGIDVQTYKNFGDLPRKDDLDRYLSSLEDVVDFSLRYTNYVDLNLGFGLFLLSVNLKPLLQSKRDKLPAHMYHRLGKLIFDNDKVMQNFRYMVKTMPPHVKMLQADAVKLTTLYSNDTQWSERMPKHTLDLLKMTKRRSRTELRMLYSRPTAYEHSVFNFKKGVPSPQLSDKCLTYLADNAVYEGLRSTDCQIPEVCKQMLKSSTTDLGYFITHRLLTFLVAHLSRGCVVFSEEEDRDAMRGICTMISDEAQYIAMNNFTVMDLLFEEVALCALSGNAQFLQRSWISEILRYQTNLGCFGNSITGVMEPRAENTDKWVLTSKSRIGIFNGYCDPHLTAVTAASVAAAVRYIMESYY